MKRLIFLFSAIAFLAGCDKLDEVSKPTHKPTQEGGVPEIVYATVADEDEEDSQTRTFVNEENYVLWHKGDAISYFTGTSHNYKYTNSEDDGAPKATFGVETDGYSSTNVEGTYAIYPYSANNSYSDNKFNVTYPATQTYAENSFGKGANLMVAASATSDDTDLYFRNACGYLIIKLYGQVHSAANIELKSVKLTALNEDVKIAGSATITTDSEGVPMVKMGDDATSEITLDCYNGGKGVTIGATKEEATEFWFALPPTAFEGGFKITAISNNENPSIFEQSTTKTITIDRNAIKPMAALEFESNIPGPHQLFYTTSDGNRLNFQHLFKEGKEPFNATFNDNVSWDHLYDPETKTGCISLGTALTHINEEAFYGKTNLTSVTLPETLTYIGENAFAGTGLTEITIPGNVTEIGVDAFYNCTALKEVTFLPNPTNEALYIGYGKATLGSEIGPFYYSPLTEVNLDRNLYQHLGYKNDNGDLIHYDPDDDDEGIFAQSNHTLKTVTLGNKVTKLPKRIFCGATALTSINIPGNVTDIDDCAFFDASNLTSVTLNEGIERIGQYAFTYNYELPSITIPGSVKEIGDYAFSYTTELTSVTLKDGVAKIGEYAFTNAGLIQIIIPGSVKTIGNHAFYGATDLTSVILQDGVQTLGTDVFNYCTALESITIPASVTHIGTNSFLYCEKLGTVDIAESDIPLRIGYQTVSGTSYGPFYDSPLSNIKVRRNMVLVDEDGNEFAADAWRHGIFANKHYDDDELTATLHIGYKVTKISDYMFSGVRVYSFWIPQEVKSIGYKAFHDCRQLVEVTLGHSTPPTLGEYAFDACDKLKNIVLPYSTIDTFKNHENWEGWKPYENKLCQSGNGN